MYTSSKQRGFTLVEIMIVVVIIGLLAATAVPGFQRARQNSRRVLASDLVRQVASAADQYFVENGATAVPYLTLVGNSRYLKNDALAVANARGLALGGLGTASTLSQGATYTVSYAGAAGPSDYLSGTW